MQDLEKQGYDAKEILNAKKDSTKIKDLDFLKTLGGPFTNKEEVDKYIKNSKFSDKEKNSRLYVEVRYANYKFVTKRNSKSFPIKEGWKETRDNGICYELDGIFR